MTRAWRERSLESLLSELEANAHRFGVTRWGATTRLDTLGVHTATAVRDGVAEGAISVYSGKGNSRSEAVATALCEAVERFAAEPSDRTPVCHVSTLDPGRKRIDLDALGGVGAGASSFCLAHRPLSNEPIYVAADAALFPVEPPRDSTFVPTTTGLAVGSTLDEAVVAGLLECIERDAYSRAVALVTAGRGHVIASLDRNIDPAVRELADRITQGGGSVHMRCLVHDLEVPAVLAVIDGEFGTHMGVAARLSYPEAAVAALLEAAQSRATVLQGAREDLMPRTEVAHPWFRADGSLVVPPAPNITVTNARAALEWLLDRLRVCGLPDPAVVDLAIEGVGLTAVRVVAPGLEQWALAPERAMARVRGWLAESGESR